jgi:hypothetical protein
VDHEVASCRACGAAIIWMIDQDGTRLPMNKTRVRSYMITGRGQGIYAKQADGTPYLVFVSHFLSCPRRELVRRVRKRAKL